MTDRIELEFQRLKDKHGRVHLYPKHGHQTLCGYRNADIRDPDEGWYTHETPDCWDCEGALLQKFTWIRDRIFDYTAPSERDNEAVA